MRRVMMNQYGLPALKSAFSELRNSIFPYFTQLSLLFYDIVHHPDRVLIITNVVRDCWLLVRNRYNSSRGRRLHLETDKNE